MDERDRDDACMVRIRGYLDAARERAKPADIGSLIRRAMDVRHLIERASVELPSRSAEAREAAVQLIQAAEAELHASLEAELSRALEVECFDNPPSGEQAITAPPVTLLADAVSRLGDVAKSLDSIAYSLSGRKPG